MILHLSRMRRNVNRKVYNDRENVSATTLPIDSQLSETTTKDDWRLQMAGIRQYFITRTTDRYHQDFCLVNERFSTRLISNSFGEKANLLVRTPCDPLGCDDES